MKLIHFALVGLIFMSFESNAQLDCAAEAGCTVVQANKTLTYTLRAPDCDATVTYDILDCGGAISIRISSYTVSGSCTAMTDFSIYHYSLSTLEEYISLAVLEYEGSAGSIPACSTGTNNVVKVYTASCGIWVGCEYEVDPATRQCDNGYLAPFPDYGVSPTKVKVYKWQSCGEVCCVNTYTICRQSSAIGGGTIDVMTKVSAVPSNTCSLESNYSPKTCQNGCM